MRYAMESLALKDKVAVVAGASQGIGEAVAKLFARHGARVILLARNREKLDKVVAAIQSEGGQAFGQSMDVGVSQNWNDLAAWIEGRGWGWDVLVNNAYWRTQTPIGEVSDADWDSTMAVSLKAYFMGARAAIPFMLRGNGGSIVNISSLQSLIPEPSFGAYAVAKGGVNALSRVIARDYGPKIRANTLVSGAVDTPGFAEGEEVKKELGSRLPAGRIGFPMEIAETALFLASERSSFITGVELIADGGRAIT
jgi:NAD(P)-dependent dehydrogenase (short-subunit alcohol dehydrogenase family)